MESTKLLFEQNPDPMLIFDMESLMILDANKSAVEQYGYTKQEFTDLTILDLCPPDENKLLTNALNQNIESEICNHGAHRHISKEGDEFIVDITSYRYPRKNINARMVQVRDITEQVELKNEIQEAYDELKHHVTNSPLAFVKFDKDFRIVSWSDRATELTGYSEEEVLGRNPIKTGCFEENEELFIAERMQPLISGEIDEDQYETCMNTKDGSKLDVQMYSSSLRDHNNDLKSVIAFFKDITDRKNEQAKLAKRSKALDVSMDGIAIMNADGNNIYVNEAYSKKFGYETPEELTGQNWKKLYSEEEIEYFENDILPDLYDKGSWSGEIQGLRKDGSGFPQEISLSNMEDGSIISIVRDITDRKEVQRELKEERIRLERAQELAQLGWWSYDVKNDMVVWSDILYEIFGVNKEDFEATFEGFYSKVYPDDLATMDKVMKKVRVTGQPLDYTIRIKRKDEEVIYLKCRAQGKFDENGELEQMTGISQDVTEQKKAQEELKLNEELFESLFVDSPVAIVMIDVDGSVRKINNSFEELFGYSEEELVDKDLLSHILPEERQEKGEDIYNNLFDNTGSSKYYEDERITKDGEIKNLLVGALPVTLDDETIAAFGIYTDITTLRLYEEELKESLVEKEILLAEIHHRVKNNLAIISGLLLLEAMNWEEESEVYKVMMQSKLRIHSMAKIHEKLYQSGNFSNLNLENYIVELVETIFESMKGDEKGVKLEIECDDINLNINQAIPCALIVNELVTNAFKYAFDDQKESNLGVRFKRRGSLVIIEVKDDGPGLPYDFEEMAEKSLGHTLVKQLVKQLDGEIEVESNGTGTVYEIKFEKQSISGSSSNYSAKN